MCRESKRKEERGKKWEEVGRSGKKWKVLRSTQHTFDMIHWRVEVGDYILFYVLCCYIASY